MRPNTPVRFYLGGLRTGVTVTQKTAREDTEMADEWAPKTRDDWTDLFADGILKARTRQEEAEAKAAAEAAKNNPPPDEGTKPRSFAERLLGA